MEVVGTVRGTRGGFAFLIREDGGEDLLIAEDGLYGAIHGDRVRVTLFPRPRDFRPLAVVEAILERSQPWSTGQLVRSGRSFFLRPDSPMLPEQIPARLGPNPPAVGAKVRFRVENSDKKNRALFGVVEEILGDAEDARLDTIVLGTEFGLSLRFPSDVLDEAEQSVAAPDLDEDARREDFRKQFVVTIDPLDAKDFDDAVSVTRTADEGYVLTVHIADVTAYVREGGALDEEALARGTSTYFPGAVVPMLPESISTVAASLTPDENKRTMTVVMEFDRWGLPRGRRITRGFIRSRARLTYEQAQAVFDGTNSIDEELDEQLRLMLELSRRLRELRFESGGFQIEVPEAKLELGADGVPTRIGTRTHVEAHELIEEFMIAANRAVGGWAREEHVPFSYRIHLPPEARAMEDFARVALMLVPSTPENIFENPKQFRRWLASLSEHRLGSVVHRFFLRAMQKAIYSATDRGHYGLGIEGYAHFTSPIRRYSDLFNHRRIKERLDRQSGPDHGKLSDLARTVSTHASRREQIAEQAEREMIRLKAARYLETRLGEVLPGRVTALTHRGLFVELALGPVEGFVPRGSFPGRMNFDEKRLAWVADRGSSEFRPGDSVRVQIVHVDLRKRQVEFALESGPSGRRAKGAEGRGRSGSGKKRGSSRHRRGAGGSGRRSAERGSKRRGSSAGTSKAGSSGRRGRTVEGRGTGAGTGSGRGRTGGSGRGKKKSASGRPRKRR